MNNKSRNQYNYNISTYLLIVFIFLVVVQCSSASTSLILSSNDNIKDISTSINIQQNEIVTQISLSKPSSRLDYVNLHFTTAGRYSSPPSISIVYRTLDPCSQSMNDQVSTARQFSLASVADPDYIPTGQEVRWILAPQDATRSWSSILDNSTLCALSGLEIRFRSGLAALYTYETSVGDSPFVPPSPLVSSFLWLIQPTAHEVVADKKIEYYGITPESASSSLLYLSFRGWFPDTQTGSRSVALTLYDRDMDETIRLTNLFVTLAPAQPSTLTRTYLISFPWSNTLSMWKNGQTVTRDISCLEASIQWNIVETSPYIPYNAIPYQAPMCPSIFRVTLFEPVIQTLSNSIQARQSNGDQLGDSPFPIVGNTLILTLPPPPASYTSNEMMCIVTAYGYTINTQTNQRTLVTTPYNIKTFSLSTSMQYSVQLTDSEMVDWVTILVESNIVYVSYDFSLCYSSDNVSNNDSHVWYYHYMPFRPSLPMFIMTNTRIIAGLLLKYATQDLESGLQLSLYIIRPNNKMAAYSASLTLHGMVLVPGSYKPIKFEYIIISDYALTYSAYPTPYNLQTIPLSWDDIRAAIATKYSIRNVESFIQIRATSDVGGFDQLETQAITLCATGFAGVYCTQDSRCINEWVMLNTCNNHGYVPYESDTCSSTCTCLDFTGDSTFMGSQCEQDTRCQTNYEALSSCHKRGFVDISSSSEDGTCDDQCTCTTTGWEGVDCNKTKDCSLLTQVTPTCPDGSILHESYDDDGYCVVQCVCRDASQCSNKGWYGWSNSNSDICTVDQLVPITCHCDDEYYGAVCQHSVHCRGNIESLNDCMGRGTVLYDNDTCHDICTCEKSSEWGGPNCSQSVVCETSAITLNCGSNGYVKKIDNVDDIDKPYCDTSCTCLYGYTGGLCQTCNIKCHQQSLNNPQARCQANLPTIKPCLCAANTSGYYCQYYDVNTSITIRNRALPQWLITGIQNNKNNKQIQAMIDTMIIQFLNLFKFTDNILTNTKDINSSNRNSRYDPIDRITIPIESMSINTIQCIDHNDTDNMISIPSSLSFVIKIRVGSTVSAIKKESNDIYTRWNNLLTSNSNSTDQDDTLLGALRTVMDKHNIAYIYDDSRYTGCIYNGNPVPELDDDNNIDIDPEKPSPTEDDDDSDNNAGVIEVISSVFFYSCTILFFYTACVAI